MQRSVPRTTAVLWMVDPAVDFEKQIKQLSDRTIVELTEMVEGWTKLPDEEHEILIDHYVGVTADGI